MSNTRRFYPTYALFSASVVTWIDPVSRRIEGETARLQEVLELDGHVGIYLERHRNDVLGGLLDIAAHEVVAEHPQVEIGQVAEPIGNLQCLGPLRAVLSKPL